MHTLKHRRRWLLGLVVAASTLALAIGAGVAWSTNYDTYYCGTATSYCTLGSGGYASTASTALRDENYVHCEYTCHTHVWYDAGSGAYDLAYTNGGTDASTPGPSISYAYSRCETDSGYGSNPARCHTTWHT